MTESELINKLYIVFSKYKFKPSFIDRCNPFSLPREEELKALYKPLQELSDDDLGRLPLKIMSSWGDEEDFKYFFPRIANSSVMTIGNDIFDYAFFPRLKDVNLDTWEEEERNLVYELLSHYLCIHLEEFAQQECFTNYFVDIVSILGVEKIKQVLMKDGTGNAAFFIARQLLNSSSEIRVLKIESRKNLESWFSSSEVAAILKKGISYSHNELNSYTIQIAFNTITTNHSETNS